MNMLRRAGETPALPGMQTGASDDDIALACIVLSSFCLAAGMLAYAGTLPLQWLPGQVPVLLACLIGAPIAAAWRTLRLCALDGLPAVDYARRTGLTQLSALALALVVLPAAEAHFLDSSGGLASTRFAYPVLVAAGLCWLARGTAVMHARQWWWLHPQAWEGTSGEGSRILAGVERDGLVARLRLFWVAGGVALAAASLLHAAYAPGQVVQTWLGVLAFLLYSASELVYLSFAARQRMVTHWHLTGVSMPDELAKEWGRLGLRAVLIAILVAGLAVGLHLIDLAHAALIGAGSFVQWLLNSKGSSVSRLPSMPPSIQPRTPPQPKVPHQLHAGPVPGFLQLLAAIFRAIGALLADAGRLAQTYWPLLLAVAAAALLTHAYAAYRKEGRDTRVWRALLAILWRDLLALRRLFGRPGRQLARNIVDALLGASASQVRRLAGRRDTPWHKLAPRSAVIAIYLTVLRYAARQGHPRQSGQTPTEYAAQVAEQVPGASEALGSLTDLFVEVRYGPCPVEPAEAGRAQLLWKALRRRLHDQGSHRPGGRSSR